jgi:hypothetical protein
MANAKNNGKDQGNGWINYGNVKVEMTKESNGIRGKGTIQNQRSDNKLWNFEFESVTKNINGIDHTQGKIHFYTDKYNIEGEINYAKLTGDPSNPGWADFIGKANWNGQPNTDFSFGFNQVEIDPFRMILVKGTSRNNRLYQIYGQDVEGIQFNQPAYWYTWEEDRDLDANYCETHVLVDFGRYSNYFGGTPAYRDEGCNYKFGYSFEMEHFTDKVIHRKETWVPGVNMPGGTNELTLKDNEGNGIYEGGFSASLFWPGLSYPEGPFIFSQKFEYKYQTDHNNDGLVTHGEYLEKQYLHMSEE